LEAGWEKVFFVVMVLFVCSERTSYNMKKKITTGKIRVEKKDNSEAGSLCSMIALRLQSARYRQPAA
jgi:hypothetical protein